MEEAEGQLVALRHRCCGRCPAQGEKPLINWPNLVILAPSGRPLGECRAIQIRATLLKVFPYQATSLIRRKLALAIH